MNTEAAISRNREVAVMMNSSKEPQQRPQNALEQIGDEIWIVEGEPVSFYGFPYLTRMAIVRLSNGDLWVWSPT